MKALPSVLTLGNLSSGMIAILFAVHDQIFAAVTMIWLSTLFDLFDGFAARKLGAESKFGKALDSLADIVSFGAAPVVLLYIQMFHNMGIGGALLLPIFPICGVIRLARYGCEQSVSHTFTGMPITMAGGLMSFFVLWSTRLLPLFAVLIIIFLSMMMVSRIPFPSLKQVFEPQEKDIAEPK